MRDRNASVPGQGGTLVPPGSRVLLRLAVVYPSGDRLGGVCPLGVSDAPALESLDCTLTVQSPSFRGHTFTHRFGVRGATTPGRHTSMDAARRQIRALIEAACRIRPDDASPRAIQARILHAWTDLDGLEFPAVVGVGRVAGRDGRVRLRNVLKAVIAMDEPDFAWIRGGGEWISPASTLEPVPELAMDSAPERAPKAALSGVACPPGPSCLTGVTPRGAARGRREWPGAFACAGTPSTAAYRAAPSAGNLAAPPGGTLSERMLSAEGLVAAVPCAEGGSMRAAGTPPAMGTAMPASRAVCRSFRRGNLSWKGAGLVSASVLAAPPTGNLAAPSGGTPSAFAAPAPVTPDPAALSAAPPPPAPPPPLPGPFGARCDCLFGVFSL